MSQKRNLRMRKVAEEIIGIKIKNQGLNTLRKQFYQIMRDNGIKEGEWADNGNSRLIANPEWTLCKTLFIDQVRGALEMVFLFNSTPEDLEAYNERPKSKKKKR